MTSGSTNPIEAERFPTPAELMAERFPTLEELMAEKYPEVDTPVPEIDNTNC